MQRRGLFKVVISRQEKKNGLTLNTKVALKYQGGRYSEVVAHRECAGSFLTPQVLSSQT